MPNASSEAREPARLLDLSQMTELLRIAVREDHPLMSLLTILLLVPCDAREVADAYVEMIDRQRGLLRLRDRIGRMVEVDLGAAGMAALHRILGARIRGPLIVDDMGQPITVDGDTEAYLRELTLTAPLDPVRFHWTFAQLRESVFASMVDECGVAHHVAVSQAGCRPCDLGFEAMEALASDKRASADMWAHSLGARPGAPFSLPEVGARVARHPRGIWLSTRGEM